MTIIKLIKMSFNGPLSGWVKLVWAIMFIEAGFLYWSLYEFFVAPDVDTRVFWGFIALFVGLTIGLTKIWYWMHIYFLWGQENKAKEEAED